MAKETLEDKILKKEILIEKLNAQKKQIDEKLSVQNKKLIKLKEEQELNELLKLKKVFNKPEDINNFLEAIDNRNIDRIKTILKV